MRRRLLAAVLVLAGVPVVPAAASEALPRVRPKAAGVDGARLAAALDAFEAAPGARSMVVVRHGAVVGERHWFGQPGQLHNVASVTKSVMSTLVGIALERGVLPGLDAPMVDFLPPELVPADPAKGAITIRHLLTMTSGLDFDEESEFLEWSRSADPARSVLDRPLAAPPGTRFNYSSADPHLLSIVLSTASGVSTEVFAEAFLFGPLGIGSWRWPADPQGYPFGGHGLQLRTEDMAKLGILFLRHGVWGGSRVVAGSWVEAATAPQVDLRGGFGPLPDVDYGWLWWLDRSLDPPVYLAWGWGGQFVFCVPGLDLVVATNAAWDVPSATADRQEEAILRVIVEDLLPAVGAAAPRRPGGAVRPGWPTVQVPAAAPGVPWGS